MKILKKYLKPYIAYALAMVLLLFCQAAVDLNLPKLMSDIVNVGIQQGGVSESAPEFISEDGLMLMSRFMTEEDREQLEKNYRMVSMDEMDESQRQSFLKRWPMAEEKKIFRFVPESEEEKNETELIFGRAAYAVVSFVQNMNHEKPETKSESVGIITECSPELLKLLYAVPEEKIQEAIQMAKNEPEAVLRQTGAAFARQFYLQLGADAAGIQNGYIIKVGGKMLLMTMLLVSFAIGVGYCASKLGTGVARDLRRDIFARVSRFTTNEYDRFGTASLITRSTNDVMQIRGLLSMGLRTMFYAPIIGIGGTVMALTKSPSMAWIIALAGIIILCIIAVLFVVAVPRFKIMQKLVDKLNLVSRENLSGMMVIRAFATEKFEEERFDRANKVLADNNLFVFRAMASMMPVMMLVMNGVSLLIVWVGGHQVAAASMQVGDMMAFIQYTIQIIMSFLMISMVFVMVPRAAVSVNRVSEVLETESSIEDDPEPQQLSEPVKGELSFNDVSFRYEGADEDVLQHITFTMRPGETTAFIGSTGSGKTTLINLIPRFYDVSSGSITLDGVDIRKIPQKELRDAIGYVPQKGVLFSGDIASNLRYGDENASDEALRSAAETAQATEFIDGFPDGYKTAISQSGKNVSGGQRQRLSIARALIKDAAVYIFDDSFSALDFKTDAKLRKALKERTKNASVLIVAQRISTIMNADRIIVLDEGRIAGIGRHRELLKNCPTYREIAESQLTKEELA